MDGCLNQHMEQLKAPIAIKAHIAEDWCLAAGKIVEIRRWGQRIRIGQVDAVAADGTIVWIAGSGVETRALFERAQGFQVWVPVLAGLSLAG